MGCCNSKPVLISKIQQQKLTAANSQENQGQVLQGYQLPKGKYNLLISNPIIVGEQTVMSVPEGLAYNFLVKQGVLRQKKIPPDGVAIFLHGDMDQEIIMKYSAVGLMPMKYGQENSVLDDGKTARILFNFKTIWVFKDKQFNQEWMKNLIQKFESIQVKPKQINYLAYPLSYLNKIYNLLDQKETILNQFYPLKLYSSQDILTETQNIIKDSGVSIFIHGSLQLEKTCETAINLYSQQLQIRNILFMYEYKQSGMINQLENALYKLDFMKFRNIDDGSLDMNIVISKFIPYINRLKQTNSCLLLIYESSQNNTNDLAKEILKEYLSRDQCVILEDIEQYMEERMGIIIKSNNNHLQSQVKQQEQEQIEPQQQQDNSNQISRYEEIKINYENLTKKTKSNLSSTSAHQTILKLLENIIDNSTDLKFRQIQTSNKRIQLNILQYEQAVQILKLCGFVPQPIESPTIYQNNFDIGMLKLCRGDLELAFKKSQDN